MTYELETETTYDSTTDSAAYLAAITPQQQFAESESTKRTPAVRKGKVAVRAKEKSSARSRS